ncbi:MAG: HlyD family efflux transporter periplasmic adaptor subunit [Planctomycetaceae bacterium]|nr:HlyD family efflux transporter periplasmic adaptor subunit [Planctomycetales bacterium]MCB9921470.1 HlyD family efflux transporter periplasmic adaptor subunit [Planctomycetaceae bacterium]
MKRDSLSGQIVSFVISALIVLAGVIGFRTLIYKPDVQASAKAEPTKPLVHTEAIRAHEGSLDIAVDGIVAPFREIEVAAEVAGKVVFKDEACNGGRFVTRGTRLLKVDPRDYDLAVRRLENQLEQADANIEELQVEISNTNELIKLAEDQVKLEQNEVARLAGLIQEKIVTDSTLDRAKQVELTARNNLVQLRNQLQLLNTRQRRLQSARELVVTDLEKAKLDLERTEILAAVDGVVIEDLVERDSFVQKGSPVFTIEDTSAVEVKCRLKMEELYWVWRQAGHDFKSLNGDSAGYSIPHIPVTVRYQLADRKGTLYEWQGVLSRFDGIGLDEQTRTVPCRVLVDKPRDVKVINKTNGAANKADRVPASEGGLPALVRGMYVTVTFHVDQPSLLLLIPERAVQPGKAVWLVSDGQLNERRGLDLIELIRIQDVHGDEQAFWLVEASAAQLAAGERVVVPPFGALRDQEAVREEASR